MAERAVHGGDKEDLRAQGMVNPVVSIRTETAYREALTGVQKWISDTHRAGLAPEGFPRSLNNLTRAAAEQYLVERQEAGYGQKTIDRDRQALEFAIQEKLAVVKSEQGPKGELAQASRAYSDIQKEVIASLQSDRNSLMTQISFAAGLRAHEAFTLRPAILEKNFNQRDWSIHRFKGKEDGVLYVVTGKGGLDRLVSIHRDLAAQLEDRRFETPQTVRDREVVYQGVRYDIGGGSAWSRSFSAASQKAFGWSTGAHGLRHSYAQNRMAELSSLGLSYKQCLGAVANEVGHFAIRTTETYLR